MTDSGNELYNISTSAVYLLTYVAYILFIFKSFYPFFVFDFFIKAAYQ
jgi:hypothetical protein